MDLIGKRIIPEEMEVLYAKPFTETSVAEDFDIRGGEWRVGDGWLTGISEFINHKRRTVWQLRGNW